MLVTSPVSVQVIPVHKQTGTPAVHPLILLAAAYSFQFSIELRKISNNCTANRKINEIGALKVDQLPIC